jgi:hypothetical protein
MRYSLPVIFPLIAFAVFSMFMVISAWAGTWRDDFNDGDFDGWRMYKHLWRNDIVIPNAGNWRVKEGVVIGGDDNENISYVLAMQAPSWTDYTAEVSVKLSKSLRDCKEWSGVYLGVRAQEKCCISYDLGVQYFGGDGLKQIQVKGGKMVKTPVEVAGGLIFHAKAVQVGTHIFPKTLFKTEPDRWYQLKVVVEGDNIQCFVDDQQVAEFQGQNLYRSGGVGFAVNGLVAMFDDFVVRGPDIPDGGPGSRAAHPQDKLTTTWAELKGVR